MLNTRRPGRPPNSTSSERKVRTLRAFETEWQVIKTFADFVKSSGANVGRAKNWLENLPK